jgi:hypothetical protein
MVLRGNVPVKFLTIGIFFNRGDIILDGIYSHYVSFFCARAVVANAGRIFYGKIVQQDFRCASRVRLKSPSFFRCDIIYFNLILDKLRFYFDGSNAPNNWY